MQRVQYVLLLYDDDDNNDGLFEVATSNIRLRPKTTFVAERPTTNNNMKMYTFTYLLLMHVLCAMHVRMQYASVYILSMVAYKGQINK